jgi:hypothetical protein
MSSRLSWALAGVAVSAVVADVNCGSNESITVPFCSAGKSIACTGPDGCESDQVCKSDGSGYGPCDCGGPQVDGGPDSGRDATGDANGALPDAPSDTSDATPDSSSLECPTWALGGIGVPPGTVATASATYMTSVPADAIAGSLSLSTNWCPGSNAGWLNLKFPAPLSITGIRLAANSDPPTSETYSFAEGSSMTPIGTATEMVNGNTALTIEPAIPLKPGSYSSITITVNGGASWVGINGVSLLTSACP